MPQGLKDEPDEVVIFPLVSKEIIDKYAENLKEAIDREIMESIANEVNNNG